MPKCKTCSNYWHKDWSVNFECKLGYDTPDFGDTDACRSYEERYTFGMERGWSYEKKRSEKRTNHRSKGKSSSSRYGYGGGGGGYGGGGYGGGGGCSAIAGGIVIACLILVGLAFFFSGPSEKEKQERTQHHQQMETEQSQQKERVKQDRINHENAVKSNLENQVRNAVASFSSGDIILKPRSRINFGEQVDMTMRLIRIEGPTITVEVCNQGPLTYEPENRKYKVRMKCPSKDYSWEFLVPEVAAGQCNEINSNLDELPFEIFSGKCRTCEIVLSQGYTDFYGQFRNVNFTYPIIN